MYSPVVGGVFEELGVGMPMQDGQFLCGKGVPSGPVGLYGYVRFAFLLIILLCSPCQTEKPEGQEQSLQLEQDSGN